MKPSFMLPLALATVLAIGSGTAALAEGPYPQVQPWPRDDTFTCIRQNPSCGRDSWWMEFWDLPDDQPVGFVHLPGFVGEATFIEAVNLVFQWPEGKLLLTQAGQHGVPLRAGYTPSFPDAGGSYHPQARQILINPTYLKTSTWMLAGLLAHELTHAADHRAGVFQGPTRRDCYSLERNAYLTQRRYLDWLTNGLVRQPIPLHLVNQHLSEADRSLANSLVRVATAPDLDQLVSADFAAICGARPY